MQKLKTPIRAIRAKCMECSCDQVKEIRECPREKCPLYPYKPYEDCCTVFTPKHPKTRPEPEKVIAQEEKLDIAALEEEAMASLETHYVSIYR